MVKWSVSTQEQMNYINQDMDVAAAGLCSSENVTFRLHHLHLTHLHSPWNDNLGKSRIEVNTPVTEMFRGKDQTKMSYLTL